MGGDDLLTIRDTPFITFLTYIPGSCLPFLPLYSASSYPFLYLFYSSLITPTLYYLEVKSFWNYSLTLLAIHSPSARSSTVDPSSSTAYSHTTATMVDLNMFPEPLRDPNNCQKEPIEGFPYSYGYKPSMVAGIIFCVLFAIAVVGHGVQSIRLRRWTSIILTIGALSSFPILSFPRARAIPFGSGIGS